MKGVQFRNHAIVGDIIELAGRYCEEQADELVFYDITASPDGRRVDRQWVEKVARIIDIPFSVAGGIKTVADAEDILRRGADKISINSPALQNPGLITELAERFGSQCVVIGIDSLAVNGSFEVQAFTGDPDKMRSTARNTLDWVREVQRRGAGEIVLNCMNRDGVRGGYDCEQLALVREVCSVPLVASGGAGTDEHFYEVFQRAGADAALAASVFHSGRIHIRSLKDFLARRGVDVRC